IYTIEEYDEKIRQFVSNGQANIENKEYELTLLQRNLVKKAGPYALTRFITESDENKETLRWLMGNLDNLRLYVFGGTPAGGSYYNSLTQLSRLYNEYSEDFKISTPIENDLCPEGMTRGDLYKKMAITLSLTHSQRVSLWMHTGHPKNQSDALSRYAIYKYMYENERLKTNLNGNWDITKWFENLEVEEMRFVMNNSIDDEEILWLNTYVQDKLDKHKGSNYLTPHPYMAYVWPNYTSQVYYDNERYFNELFSITRKSENSGIELVSESGEVVVGKVGLFDSRFTIPGGKKITSYTFQVSRGTSNKTDVLSKVWMNFRNKFNTGAVCGGISKTGTNIRATHGIPATVIGQPGHAAILYYTQDAQGRGVWNIDNDVSGWTLSEKGERMLLGWGNASYSKGYSVVYMALAQEVINDFPKFIESEETLMLADSYSVDLKDNPDKQKADLAKQEEIYRESLEIQPININ
ncbi:MAG: hypothetical protein K2H53_06600, partial [Clostridia bacterium]|nr:hypothetical protein [Clostridia bacterium]